jgi:hypothetical protein
MRTWVSADLMERLNYESYEEFDEKEWEDWNVYNNYDFDDIIPIDQEEYYN